MLCLCCLSHMPGKFVFLGFFFGFYDCLGVRTFRRQTFRRQTIDRQMFRRHGSDVSTTHFWDASMTTLGRFNDKYNELCALFN